MELRQSQSLNLKKIRQIEIFYSKESFQQWHKQYISKLDKQDTIDSIIYPQYSQEIDAEQKQFISQQGSQIKTLQIRLIHKKLYPINESNLKFLFLELTKLESLHLTTKYITDQQIIILLLEIEDHHQNIKVLKFKHSFYSTPELSKYINKLKNIESLKLRILNSENPEFNTLNESQNLSQLKKFSVMIDELILQNISQNSTIIYETNEINQCKSLIDSLLNRIIEMKDLKKLTLNISGKLKTVDCFNLLNQSLQLKHDLERISIDISYHTLDYNIANILQLNQQLQKISINCSSSYSFRFEQIHNNYPQDQLKQLVKSGIQNQISSLQVQNQFIYQNLQILILKLNFTKSLLVNSLFNFLSNQTSSISKTLRHLHLEISFIYPNLCIQSIGQFISQQQCLEDLKFQCNSDNIDYMRDNIYLLRQITKLAHLKELLFQMKVIEINNEYLQLVQCLIQKCEMIDINILNTISLKKTNQLYLNIYTIQNYYPIFNSNLIKNNTPDVLTYTISTFINMKMLYKLEIQLVYIKTQSKLEISQFVSQLANFKMLKILIIRFSWFELPEIKYLINEIVKLMPQLKLLKDLQLLNNNFQQSKFKDEYYSLMTTSLSSNIFLNKINLENYTNTLYGDQQLLNLRDLLNQKNKISRNLFSQIRSISNKWPINIRKQIFLNMIIDFFV